MLIARAFTQSKFTVLDRSEYNNSIKKGRGVPSDSWMSLKFGEGSIAKEKAGDGCEDIEKPKMGIPFQNNHSFMRKEEHKKSKKKKL